MLQLPALLIAIQVICKAFSATAIAVNQGQQTNSSLLFHHRGYHSSIVIGDYLYIDGGEITTWNGTGDGIDGSSTDGSIITLPDNYTYSIDLASDWTNSSLTINSIEKAGAPVLNGFALWPGASNKSFYTYDGGVSSRLPANLLPPPPANALWQFTPDGNTGTWSNVPLQPGSNFTSLSRLELGAYAFGNGLGFALGGYLSWRTTTSDPVFATKAWMPTPGMVIYNTTSQDWLNVSTSGPSGYSQYGWATEAAAWFVPSFGSAGLLAVLGGQTTDHVFPTLDAIYFYDPTSQRWAFQKTSGTSPAPSINACVVGAQGDNDTYEIFYYGGGAQDLDSTISNGAVHVLSLPSFNWQKQADTSVYGRFHHSCSVAEPRQMIAVGGIVVDAAAFYTLQSGKTTDIVDPWSQGLGVFDMSDLEWKDSYTADAAPYVTPIIVKTYYMQHGRYPDSWDSSTLEGWFTQKGTNSSSNSTSPPPPQSPSSSLHHSETGTIVGGVVGGIVGSIIVIVGGFFLLRRQRRRRNQTPARAKEPPQDYTRDYARQELDSSQETWTKKENNGYTLSATTQLHNDRGMGELPSTSAPLSQLGGNQIYEMPEGAQL